VANIERTRDFLSTPPDAGYFSQKLQAGWRLVAIDWERGDQAVEAPQEDAPFGLQVAADCMHLTEQPSEKEALLRMMEMIVQDQPLPEVAAELNRSGYRMRTGLPWTASALFDLLPRLIEAGPKILTDEEYVSRKHARA
jgi:hypothetical protein